MSKALVSELWQTYLDKKEHDLDKIVELMGAVNKDLNLRDYLLGFPLEVVESGVSSDTALLMVGEFVSGMALALEGQTDTYGLSEKDFVPFMVISAIINWETSDTNELALEGLALALSVNPDYGLAKLMKQFIMSGENKSALWNMRSALHSKVATTL